MKTHIRYISIYLKLIFFKCFYKYANLSHELFVDLKKESIVRWCCHFKLATCNLISFSDVAYSFITFVGVNSNRLSIKKCN